MAEYLFVVGTLRKELWSRLAPELQALMQGLRFVGTGHLAGELYDLGPYPGAIVGADFATNVIGEIYELSEPQVTLAQLDGYEGFVPGELEASLFARNQETITLDDGQQLVCWMYVYNDWVATGHLIPNGDYLEYLRQR